MSTSFEYLHSALALALQKAQQGVELLQLDARETRDSVAFLPQQDGFVQSCQQSCSLVSIDSVNSDLLNSGLAIYLGCCDRTRDTGVVLIYCKHPAWTLQCFTITHLSSLLLYYQHLCRKQLTLIVDARDSTREVIHALLETISEVEMHSPGDCAIDIVHILVDRISQALILRSPFFRNTSRIHSSQIDLISNIDVMYRVVAKEHLPVELGGHLLPYHLHWVRFRKLYDSLMGQCLEAATNLIKVAEHLSLAIPAAKSESEISKLISQHFEELENPLQVISVSVHNGELERKFQMIRGDGIYLSQNVDYRDSLNVIQRLLQHLMESIKGLSHLANLRFGKLNVCLQAMNFQENCKKVLSSLDMINKEILEKYLVNDRLPDNFLQLQVLQQEFLQISQSAQAELSKAGELLKLGLRMNDMYESWTVQLTQHCCTDLQRRIDELSTHLETVRKKLDLMVQCNQLLTKAHGWIESAIKFFADANPSIQGATLFDLEKYVSDLENCLREQPLSSADQLLNMTEECQKFASGQMVDQCVKVQGQYSEVLQLIKGRLDHLRSKCEKLRHQQFLYRRRPFAGSSEGVNDNSESLAFLRRRSYAGKPSTPMCSAHVEAFKRKDMDIQDYEEYLFSEGLITDDMSERIVTSLPKGLSDVTMRGSRESLRSSKESLHGSQESLGFSSMSCESLASSSSAYQDFKPSHLPSNKLFGKPLRFFKKAVSFLTENSSTPSSNLLSTTSSAAEIGVENLECHVKRVNEEQNSEENRLRQFPSSTNIPVIYNNGQTERCKSPGSSFNEGKELEEAKRLRNQSHIMSEMIQTEKDYVHALQFVITNYMPELNRDDLVQPLRGKRSMIFGNLEKIYLFHSHFFLKELELCCDTPLRVGTAFLQHATSFYLYALYSKNKPKSDALMKECGTGFFMRKQQELGEKLDLCSYLLKPVQRMGKYALLLEELLKECPDSNSEHSLLKEALEMVKFQLRHGNDLLAMDSIRRSDVNLQEQGRLLLQDSFSVTLGHHKTERHIFLFEDMIVFTKARRRGSGIDSLDYKDSFKTSDIGLTENVSDERKFEIWFRKRTPGVTYILEAPSADVKQLWIGNLSRLLWKQAIRNRQRRRNELVEMGHDLKPGTDLTQSNNYINDRMVSINPHTKLSRIRNSISVTSSDHFKTGYKRPHSMISVNSSFSGNNRSSGYFSNLSTTFELPTESLDVKDDTTTTQTIHLFRPSPVQTAPLWSHSIETSDDGQCTDV